MILGREASIPSAIKSNQVKVMCDIKQGDSRPVRSGRSFWNKDARDTAESVIFESVAAFGNSRSLIQMLLWKIPCPKQCDVLVISSWFWAFAS